MHTLPRNFPYKPRRGWHSFAQNVKKLEVYLDMIKNGSFPLLKGHVLTTEDLSMRVHILNIMCKGTTSWLSEENFDKSVLERLKPLQDDGLVNIDRNTLTVTSQGKAFLRNICMAFDMRLWENKPNSQIFSRAV